MLTLIVAWLILALFALFVASLPWYWAVLVIAGVVLTVRAMIGLFDLPDVPDDRQTGDD